MSSNGFETPLQIDRRPSLQLGLLVAITHCLAVSILPFTDLPFSIKCLMLAAIGLSLASAFYRHILLSHPRSVLSVRLDSGADWTLVYADGSSGPADLLGDTYIHPRMTILNFRTGWRRKSVVLMPDSAHPDQLRRLRVHLKWSGHLGLE